MAFGVGWDTPAGSDRPLTMSTSSNGSFQSSLYLLAVSITLAAVYLRGWRGGRLSCTCPQHPQARSGGKDNPKGGCSQAWWYSQAHGAAAEGTRLALQRGAHQQVREEEEGAVLLATHRLLQSHGRHQGVNVPMPLVLRVLPASVSPMHCLCTGRNRSRSNICMGTGRVFSGMKGDTGATAMPPKPQGPTCGEAPGPWQC